MKRMIYQVYVGKRSKLYDHCIASVAEYCKKHNIDHIVQRTPILMIKPDPFATNRSREAVERLGYLPIFEKENAFTYLPKYDQIAIIDSDIWIRPDSPNIFEQVPEKYSFGGVVERDAPITDQHVAKVVNYSRMQYGTLKSIDWKWNNRGAEFYNMGMMVINKNIQQYLRGQTPKQFLMRPEFKPFVDGVGTWKWSTDQTLLNVWVKQEKMKVVNLPYVWNCLYKAVKPQYVQDAHFVHFFLKDKLPARGENVQALINEVQ